jgi:cytochrome b561
MQLSNTADRFGAIPQGLHWVMAALVALSWASGTFGDDLPRGAARAAGLSVHLYSGLTIVVLLVIRLAWRIADPPPSPEQTPLGKFGEWTSYAVHVALYVLLIAVLAIGITLQFARGDALSIFGLYDIASPWPRDRAFARSVKDIHETLANGLVILAGLHAVAALIHHWILRDRTLVRMLPFSR